MWRSPSARTFIRVGRGCSRYLSERNLWRQATRVRSWLDASYSFLSLHLSPSLDDGRLSLPCPRAIFSLSTHSPLSTAWLFLQSTLTDTAVSAFSNTCRSLLSCLAHTRPDGSGLSCTPKLARRPWTLLLWSLTRLSPPPACQCRARSRRRPPSRFGDSPVARFGRSTCQDASKDWAGARMVSLNGHNILVKMFTLSGGGGGTRSPPGRLPARQARRPLRPRRRCRQSCGHQPSTPHVRLCKGQRTGAGEC